MLLLIPSAYAASLPGDGSDGKRLHDASCMGCHDTGIYSRTDRVVQSLDSLKEQLAGCSHMAQKKFSASETQKFIKYLNDQFYQFR
jgi:cytochrome c5